MICYVVHIASAKEARKLSNCHRWFVLRYGTGTHRSLAGYTCQHPAPSPARVRQRWGGARGAFTYMVVDMQSIHTTAACGYVCRLVDMGVQWYLCCYCIISLLNFCSGPAQFCAGYHRISHSSVDGPQPSDPPASSPKSRGPDPRVSEQVVVGSVLIASRRTRSRLGGHGFRVDAGWF